MILPAWLDLMDTWVELMHDDSLTPSAQRVYARLVRRGPEILKQPQVVKVTNLARQLGVRWQTAQEALDLLIERGYVLESPRGQRSVRRVTLTLPIAPYPKP